jgi:hypothetical protein
MFWVKNTKERDHLGELDFEGKMILEWILARQSERVWTGFIWLRIGTSGGSL